MQQSSPIQKWSDNHRIQRLKFSPLVEIHFTKNNKTPQLGGFIVFPSFYTTNKIWLFCPL